MHMRIFQRHLLSLIWLYGTENLGVLFIFFLCLVWGSTADWDHPEQHKPSSLRYSDTGTKVRDTDNNMQARRDGLRPDGLRKDGGIPGAHSESDVRTRTPEYPTGAQQAQTVPARIGPGTYQRIGHSDLRREQEVRLQVQSAPLRRVSCLIFVKTIIE